MLDPLQEVVAYEKWSLKELTVIYFNSFYGLRLVDFHPFWFLFPIHTGKTAFVAVVYENKLLAKETDR